MCQHGQELRALITGVLALALSQASVGCATSGMCTPSLETLPFSKLDSNRKEAYCTTTATVVKSDARARKALSPDKSFRVVGRV
jgi:hypothetical protein